MNTALPFSIILPVLILFSIDPYTSLVADNTYKINYRDSALIDDKFKGKSSNTGIHDVKHICPNCGSVYLSFQTLNTFEGKQIQLINCRICDYEWREVWVLPNWLWLKLSSPDNHWTSERWNTVI
jgi:hypothetical protein